MIKHLTAVAAALLLAAGSAQAADAASAPKAPTARQSKIGRIRTNQRQRRINARPS